VIKKINKRIIGRRRRKKQREIPHDKKI
jgi:hypothetical protein